MTYHKKFRHIHRGTLSHSALTEAASGFRMFPRFTNSTNPSWSLIAEQGLASTSRGRTPSTCHAHQWSRWLTSSVMRINIRIRAVWSATLRLMPGHGRCRCITVLLRARCGNLSKRERFTSSPRKTWFDFSYTSTTSGLDYGKVVVEGRQDATTNHSH
jgi:hypothetical protein